jgi:hypothetical protein
MATISENLQILKDSTDAIKQAIIDKGGTIEGDISTWANVINGLSGGGSSSEEEYVFTGTMSYNMTKVTIIGNLNKIPDIERGYLLALGWSTGGLCAAYNFITNTGPYTLTVDFWEPLLGNEMPAICILNIHQNKYNITPVKFTLTLDTDPA